MKLEEIVELVQAINYDGNACCRYYWRCRRFAMVVVAVVADVAVAISCSALLSLVS